MSLRRLDTQHKDVVHDVSYDYYGKRMATCGSDHTVKVFDRNEDGDWVSTTLEQHNGPVWKVCWAHPEYGSVLATCSNDRRICIWEEQQEVDACKKWKKVADIQDFRLPVQDIKFAPRHQGLKLAVACDDGKVRIYEAEDVMNLSTWTSQSDFDVERGGVRVTCCSWNASRFNNASIVTGGSNGSVKVWMHDQGQRCWVLQCCLETGASDQEEVHDVVSKLPATSCHPSPHEDFADSCCQFADTDAETHTQ